VVSMWADVDKEMLKENFETHRGK